MRIDFGKGMKIPALKGGSYRALGDHEEEK
jgi:hypothetical protein